MAKAIKKLKSRFIQRANPLQTNVTHIPKKEATFKVKGIQFDNPTKLKHKGMLKDIKHQKLFLNIQHSSLNETLIYTVSQSSTMNPQLLFSAIWTYIRSTEQQVLDSTYTVIRLLNKSLASWAYKQNLNALDLEESLFRLFYCGINEIIQGRKRSQNRMANWSYQLVSRHNLLIIQNSSFTTPPSKRKTTLKETIIKF